MARSISAEMHSSFQNLRQQCPMIVHRKRAAVDFSAETLADIARIEALWPRRVKNSARADRSCSARFAPPTPCTRRSSCALRRSTRRSAIFHARIWRRYRARPDGRNGCGARPRRHGASHGSRTSERAGQPNGAGRFRPQGGNMSYRKVALITGARRASARRPRWRWRRRAAISRSRGGASHADAGGREAAKSGAQGGRGRHRRQRSRLGRGAVRRDQRDVRPARPAVQQRRHRRAAGPARGPDLRAVEGAWSTST